MKNKLNLPPNSKSYGQNVGKPLKNKRNANVKIKFRILGIKSEKSPLPGDFFTFYILHIEKYQHDCAGQS